MEIGTHWRARGGGGVREGGGSWRQARAPNQLRVVYSCHRRCTYPPPVATFGFPFLFMILIAFTAPIGVIYIIPQPLLSDQRMLSAAGPMGACQRQKREAYSVGSHFQFSTSGLHLRRVGGAIWGCNTGAYTKALLSTLECVTTRHQVDFARAK